MPVVIIALLFCLQESTAQLPSSAIVEETEPKDPAKDTLAAIEPVEDTLGQVADVAKSTAATSFGGGSAYGSTMHTSGSFTFSFSHAEIADESELSQSRSHAYRRRRWRRRRNFRASRRRRWRRRRYFRASRRRARAKFPAITLVKQKAQCRGLRTKIWNGAATVQKCGLACKWTTYFKYGRSNTCRNGRCPCSCETVESHCVKKRSSVFNLYKQRAVKFYSAADLKKLTDFRTRNLGLSKFIIWHNYLKDFYTFKKIKQWSLKGDGAVSPMPTYTNSRIMATKKGVVVLKYGYANAELAGHYNHNHDSKRHVMLFLKIAVTQDNNLYVSKRELVRCLEVKADKKQSEKCYSYNLGKSCKKVIPNMKQIPKSKCSSHGFSVV